MKKSLKTLIPALAIASSALLGSGAMQSVSAAPARQTQAALNMKRFNERVASLSEVAALKKGDKLTLSDDGSVTGNIWSGTYVYYPAGSVVPAAPMYVRWQDGVVAISRVKNPKAGQPDLDDLAASYVAHTTQQPIRSYDMANQPLVKDGSDGSVRRIPGNAWLFRVSNSGEYTTLVDAFVFESGSVPVSIHKTSDGKDAKAYGSQPVAVSVHNKK
jgi:hypothetical protein